MSFIVAFHEFWDFFKELKVVLSVFESLFFDLVDIREHVAYFRLFFKEIVEILIVVVKFLQFLDTESLKPAFEDLSIRQPDHFFDFGFGVNGPHKSLKLRLAVFHLMLLLLLRILLSSSLRLLLLRHFLRLVLRNGRIDVELHVDLPYRLQQVRSDRPLLDVLALVHLVLFVDVLVQHSRH